MLDGGAGNDTLYGNSGNDAYKWGAGVGNDVIDEQSAGGADVLELAAGITADQLRFTRSSYDLIITLNTGETLTIKNLYHYDAGTAVANQIETLRFADGSTMSLTSGLPFKIEGTSASETLYGASQSETILGYAGNDTIYANEGVDIIDGGVGNDVLYGGTGNDTYRWGAGFGNDVIEESGYYASGGGIDVIELAAGITPDQVRFTAGQHLVITLSTGETLTILNHFSSGHSNAPIETLRFSDGTEISLTSGLVFKVEGTSASETLYGAAHGETILGYAGNDTIYAYDGADIIEGGLGNDVLYGGTGNDTYRWGAGLGDDVIEESGQYAGGGGLDVIELAAGVTPDQVRFTRPYGSYHLIITLSTGETLTILNHFSTTYPNGQIEKLRFADGTEINLAAGLNFVGASAADSMQGSGYGDTLDGGAGNDSLYGDAGDDTYVWRTGDGNDYIDEQFRGGADTIKLGPGITPDNIRLNRDGAYGLVIILSSGETLTVKDHFNQGAAYNTSRIEKLRFDDGTEWNLLGPLLFKGSEGNDGAIMASQQNDTLRGLGGNDVLWGWDGNDQIEGGAGQDSLYGEAGNDTLDGGADNDWLGGGAGNDVYRWAPGNGNDTIDEQNLGGVDVIELTTAVNTEQVVFTKAGNNLVITVSGQTLTVVNQYASGNATSQIEKIRFADGAEYEIGSLLPLLGSTAADASLFGTSGDDIIYGFGGNDTLKGMAGIDVLEGGAGDDTYIWNIGDGNDTIREASGTDRLKFGTGITVEDIGLTRFGNNLEIRHISGALITVEGYFASADKQLDALEFVDGTILDMTTAIAVGTQFGDDYHVSVATGGFILGYQGADTLTGGAGNDLLVAGSGDDTLLGQGGNDVLRGGADNDTYIIGLNHGADTLSETSGTDKIVLADGIKLEDVRFAQDGQDLVITLPGTGNSLRIVGQRGTDANAKVETLTFADGQVISLLNNVPIHGTSGNDSSLTGATGVDIILGLGGNDTLDGAAGNDLLRGGLGDDVYLWSAGNDTIQENGGADIIAFGAGITSANVNLTVDGQDLLITVAGDTLRVVGHFNPDRTTRVEKFRFADNSEQVINIAPVAVVDAAVSGTEDTAITILKSALLGNDTDIDGDTLTITSVQGATHGTVTLDVDGNVLFTPDADYNGTVTFTYTISDGNGGTATQTVTINLASVNDAPVVTGETTTIAEDATFTVSATALLSNDTDVEGGTLSIVSVQGATHGTVALVDGQVTFTPTADYNGPASFTYTVSDGQGGTTTGTVNLTITAVNDAPRTQGDTVTTNEDTAVTITAASLLANDTEVEGQTMTITSVQGATHGTVSLNGTDIVFTPAANYYGPASFTYTVSDGNGGTTTQSVTINVTSVNDAAPDTTADTASTNEDTAITILKADLLGNDTDEDGDTLTITSVQDAAHGTVTLNSSGNVVFTPDANYNGSATFTYTVSDGNGGSTTETVTVTINAVNDAPIVTNDTVSVNEDGSLTIQASSLLANDSDVEGQTLSITAVGSASTGTVSLSNGEITFTPAANFNGTATFTYTASDGNGGTTQGTVTVTVNAINDAPVLTADTANATEDTAVTILKADLLGNDTDIDGNTLSITSVQNATHGTVSLNGNGDVVFTPEANYNGTATFTYTVSDGTGGTATQTVTITIGAVNDAPSVVNDTASMNEDGTLTIQASSLLSNDSDVEGQTLSITGVGNASTGTVSLSNGEITFTPAANFNGTATFAYTASDGNGGTTQGTVTVTMNAVNDAPVLTADSKSTNEDTAITILKADLLGNDTDVEGNTLTITSVQSATHGTVSLDGNGDVLFTPDANYNGSATFTYTVSDGNGGSATQTVTITVNAVNDAPNAQDDTVGATLNTATTFLSADLLSNDNDVDGQTLTLDSVGNADHGTVSIDVNGNILFTPDTGFTGTASFTYTVKDPNNLTDTALVTVNVAA